MNKAKDFGTGHTTRRAVIFKLIMVLIPVLILLLSEGLLRLAGYGDNLDLFIKNPVKGYEKYMIVNPEIGKKYFQKLEYTAPANDIFLKEKSANGFRIFVMGSSVVYGFPYERNLMFSRILHQRLEDAFPYRKIEVVNTAITAVNSYTLADLIDQILDNKPDAILIYEGHNEFYGAFGTESNESIGRNIFITRLHLFMMDFRLYQLMRNVIGGTFKPGDTKNTGHGTLMKRMAAGNGVLLESAEYRITMKRYRQNLENIAGKVHRKNVPLFISEVVSNVHDLEPFCSMPGTKEPAAGDVFQLADNAEKDGNFVKALELFNKAKDLDCIRFRASEDINAIISEIAQKENAVLVPMLSRFQKYSPHELIGNNLMTEHVHPNAEGSFLMADVFFDEIVRSGVLGKFSSNGSYSSAYYQRNWGYTPLDSLLANHRIMLLKGFWPFVKTEEGRDYRTSYKPASPLDSLAFSIVRNPALSLADLRLNLAQHYQKSGQYYQAYREYEALIRMNPYLAVNYRDAAQCLLQLADLPLALKYFQKSGEFENSFFAGFRIGEIYLLMGDYENAARWFEKSFPLAPDDKKVNVLAKSYVAFLYGNKVDRARAVADELRRIHAAGYLNVPPKSYTFGEYIPYQTRDQVNQARLLIERNETGKALELLDSSLAIYDSHIAGRLAGEICMGLQQNEKALFYFNKVYPWFRFDPEFLQNFALVCLSVNDSAKAKKILGEIRDINPGYQGIERLNLLLSGIQRD